MTRERPFEVALARGLAAVLPSRLVVRTGGKPSIPNFPRLGTFDVSVSAPPSTDLLAVMEFKWWSHPGRGLPAKLPETLWDLLKLACTVARTREQYAFLVTLAPQSAWALHHDFVDLFAGGEWSTSRLCHDHPRAMVYFGDDHYGSTSVPDRISTEPIRSDVIVEAQTGEEWALRTVAVIPTTSLVPLPRPVRMGRARL